MIRQSMVRKLGLFGLVLGCFWGGAGELRAAVLRSQSCEVGDCSALSVGDEIEAWIALSWSDIWRWLRPKRGSGTIRTHLSQKKLGCMIAPGKLFHVEEEKGALDQIEEEITANLEPVVMASVSTSVKVWNPRPLFLWEGEWAMLEIYAYGDDEPVLRVKLEPGQQSYFYQGKPLKSNKNGYYWQLSPSTGDALTATKDEKAVNEGPFRKSFRMMKADQAEEISQRLDDLMEQLRANEASSEQIAVARMNFFMAENLGADVLREIYQSSVDLGELQQEIQGHDFCPESAESDETVAME